MKLTQQQIERLRTLQESYDELADNVIPISDFAIEVQKGKLDIVKAITEKGGESSTDKTLCDIAKDIKSLSAGTDMNLQGMEWYGEQPKNIQEALLRIEELKTIVNNDTENATIGKFLIGVNNSLYYNNNVSIIFLNATSITNAYYNTGILRNLVAIYAPKVVSPLSSRFVYSSAKIRELYIPKILSGYQGYFYIGDAVNYTTSLIDITCGENFESAEYELLKWNPTEALLDNSTSLLTDEDIANGFASNLEKLLWNITHHIAANLREDAQGTKRIGFSASVKNAIINQTSGEVASMIASKGWTIV